jgi:hypothetical protein
MSIFKIGVQYNLHGAGGEILGVVTPVRDKTVDGTLWKVQIGTEKVSSLYIGEETSTGETETLELDWVTKPFARKIYAYSDSLLGVANSSVYMQVRQMQTETYAGFASGLAGMKYTT